MKNKTKMKKTQQKTKKDKPKEWYSTLKNKKGTWQIIHWIETFIDESTGEVIEIERHEPFKLNGEKLKFYSDSEINKMTLKQRREILI